MAVSREQAILELILEVGNTLKGFDQVSEHYQRTAQELRSATEKADIDRLTRDANEARDAMVRLAEKGRAQLRSLADAGKIASTEYKQLRGDVDRLDAAIAAADRELEEFNREGRKVDDVRVGVQKLRAAWVAAAAAAATLAIGLRAIISETEKQEAAQAQVRAAIESTGGAAGVTAEELGEMASSLQSVTTFADDTILGMQSLLLTFTSLRREELPEISERVLDLSTALAAGGEGGQIDLRSAAVQVGKALQDPIRGITAMRRSGIDFTEAQQEQIKVLVESNRLYDAQRIILDALAEQVGGRARAAATTFGGALKQAQNAGSDLLEVVGQQGLNKELSVLARLFTESSGGGTELAKALGQLLAFVVSLTSRGLQLFEALRGGFALMSAGAVQAFRGIVFAGNAAWVALLSGARATFGGIASALAQVNIPGSVDDAFREAAAAAEVRLAGLVESARRNAEEADKALGGVAGGLVDVFGERLEAFNDIGEAVARIRKEIEAAGAAAGGPLAGGLDEAGDELAAFRDELFGNAEALTAHAEKIVAVVNGLGGLGNATAAQREVITAEVQKLVDGFATVGVAPPAALDLLARSMGITASAIKKGAEDATGALRGLVDAAQEVSKIPVSRFKADLALDEGAISEQLAKVEARLEEIRGADFVDPAEQFALEEQRSNLLGDLSRAQRAYQEVLVDTNRAQGDATTLSEEHIRVLREQGLLVEDLAEGLGLTEQQMARANLGFRVAGEGLGGLVESGTEAAQVTLPALDEELLESARSSGALDESLQGIAERLLVTAGNAGQAGAGLAAAGKEGAAAAKQAAEETQSASEKLKEQIDLTKELIRQQGLLRKSAESDLPAVAKHWGLVKVEIDGATEACSRLRECQGGG